MNYITKEVFALTAANTMIDTIMYQAKKYFDDNLIEIILNDRIGLSGQAALIWQKQPVEPINQIVFVVNHPDLFDVISRKIIEKFKYQGIIYFQDRTIFYFKDFIIEFWFYADATTTIVDEIAVQYYEEIPEELIS